MKHYFLSFCSAIVMVRLNFPFPASWNFLARILLRVSVNVIGCNNARRVLGENHLW